MKKLAGLFAVAVCLAGGWFLASPYWTLHQLREGVAGRDAARVAAFIDFPAVREDLKSDLSLAMMAHAAKDTGNAMGAAGMGLGMMLVGGMVDQLVSPDGIRMVLAGETKGVLNPDDVDDFEVVRDGISQFRLRSASEPEKAAVIFTRRGLGWVVTGVDLPPEALDGMS